MNTIFTFVAYIDPPQISTTLGKFDWWWCCNCEFSNETFFLDFCSIFLALSLEKKNTHIGGILVVENYCRFTEIYQSFQNFWWKFSSTLKDLASKFGIKKQTFCKNLQNSQNFSLPHKDLHQLINNFSHFLLFSLI